MLNRAATYYSILIIAFTLSCKRDAPVVDFNTRTYEQTHLHKTICKMYGLISDYSDGKAISEIYRY